MKSVKSRSLATVAVMLGMLFVTASPAAASPLTYHGGSVVRNPQVRVVFWGSNWNNYPGAREKIQGLFSTLSGTNYQGILTQYYDTGGFISPNVGFDSWTDQSIAAPNNVNWLHIEEEIQYAIVQRGWPGGGINNVYMVLPAPGSKYQAGFILGCASHYYSSLVGSPMAYVGWPGDPDFKTCTSYDPGKQNRAWAAASVTSSHEYAEAVTDPVTKKYAGTFTGWITEEGEDEIADKCVYMGGGMANGFYVNYLWDNSQNQCTLSHPVAPPPSPPIEAAFVDAGNANTTTSWQFDSSSGWQQVFMWGHEVAAGTRPAMLKYGGTTHIFYVDASRGNQITEWSWNPVTGWQQAFLATDPVAAGSSPSAVMANGTPEIYFSDAAAGRSIAVLIYDGSKGTWQQAKFNGDPVAVNSSPSAIVTPGGIQIFFADSAKSNTIAVWTWNSALQQSFFYGDPVAANSSPSAIVTSGGGSRVFFADAAKSNTIAVWTWNSALQQSFFYGDSVAANSSPSAIETQGSSRVFFADAAKSNTIAVWTWNSALQQSFFYGDSVAADTSPAAVLTSSGNSRVYFNDASTNNSMSFWEWGATLQQTRLYGHPFRTGSSPGA